MAVYFLLFFLFPPMREAKKKGQIVHCNGLSKEVVESLSLEFFSNLSDSMTLWNLPQEVMMEITEL